MAAKGDCLIVLKGPQLGQKLNLQAHANTIGSAPGSDIAVDHESVEPEHAIITVEDYAILLEDNDSETGTFVNGTKVRAAYLRDGDLIKLGSIILKFISSVSESASYVLPADPFPVTVDGLTGVFNRRYLFETMEREINRARRYERPLSLAMLDIDDFKRCNETVGHRAGDQVLRELGPLITNWSRRVDVVARYGGDSFVILRPEQGLADITAFAQRVREGIEQHRFETGGLRVSITVSIGVAELEPHHTGDSLIELADARLARPNTRAATASLPPNDRNTNLVVHPDHAPLLPPDARSDHPARCFARLCRGRRRATGLQRGAHGCGVCNFRG